MNQTSVKFQVLVVDDSPNTVELLQRNLESQGFIVFTATNVNDAICLLEQERIDLVITDYKMPMVTGLDLIKHVRNYYSDIEVIMITGYASVEGAVEAVKLGAEEYLSKPFTDEELFIAVNNAIEKLQIKRTTTTAPLKKTPSGLIGESKAMTKVFESISKASKTSATVLITGESGTGKELVARAIHYGSLRASSPFVPVNCGGIPDSLLESELFGHVKGAFTGASESRAGFFQTAEGGSIFLDEISETSLSMQVKLLRVLQEKEISMVGSSRTVSVNIRAIAATNIDLLDLSDKDKFRKDLFYRLNVLSISIPPLRERGEDILILFNYFINKFTSEFEKETPKVPNEIYDVLLKYSWPGNVRELENLALRLVVMSDTNTIKLHDLPSHMKFSIHKSNNYNRTLAEVECEYIQNVLASVKGNKSKASDVLGIDRKTLTRKLSKVSAGA